MQTPRRPDADAPDGGVRVVHASLPVPERRGRLAAFISFLLHLCLILLAIKLTTVVVIPKSSPIGDAIQIALGGGGGGGQGGAEFAVQKPPPPPPPVTPPVVQPEPIPKVIPPTVTPPVAEPTPPVAAPKDTNPAASTGASAGRGTGSGGGEGTGEGPGKGSGRGPGSGAGSGGGTGGGRGGYPAEPYQLILPALDAPKALRGKTVAIAFVISPDGKVVDFKVAPPIQDKGYAKRFDDTMRGYRFHPARDADGKAIEGTYTIEVTLGG